MESVQIQSNPVQAVRSGVLNDANRTTTYFRCYQHTYSRSVTHFWCYECCEQVEPYLHSRYTPHYMPSPFTMLIVLRPSVHKPTQCTRLFTQIASRWIFHETVGRMESGGGVWRGEVRDASGVTIRVCCHSNEVNTNALKQLSGEERKSRQLRAAASHGTVRECWWPCVWLRDQILKMICSYPDWFTSLG